MSRSRRARVALAVALLFGVPGCSTIEHVIAFGADAQATIDPVVLDDPETALEASCEGRLRNDVQFAAPVELPALDDSHWLRTLDEDDGTKVYLNWVEAPDYRLPDIRAAFFRDGKARGYTTTVTAFRDRQATVTFRGKRADVDVQVQPYCAGRLAFRYVVRRLELDAAPLLPPDVASATPCDQVETLPSPPDAEEARLPFPAGATLLRIGRTPSSTTYTAYLAGRSSVAATVRNGLLDALRSRGYVVGVEPARGGAATASIAGRRQGRLLVQPLCDRLLAVRYVLQVSVDETTPAEAAVASCDGRLVVGPTDLPSWLQLPGLTVLDQDDGESSTTWRSFLRGSPATLARATREIAGTYEDNGTTARAAPTSPGQTALVLTRPGLRALLVIRPLCVDHLALNHVVTR